jgi:hypothetical protein
MSIIGKAKLKKDETYRADNSDRVTVPAGTVVEVIGYQPRNGSYRARLSPGAPEFVVWRQYFEPYDALLTKYFQDEEERNKKALAAFLNEYEALCIKHRMRITTSTDGPYYEGKSRVVGYETTDAASMNIEDHLRRLRKNGYA